MARMTSVMDVEARARGFVKDRYPPRTVRQILFRRRAKEGDVWSTEEEVWLKSFFSRSRNPSGST